MKIFKYLTIGLLAFSNIFVVQGQMEPEPESTFDRALYGLQKVENGERKMDQNIITYRERYDGAKEMDDEEINE